MKICLMTQNARLYSSKRILEAAHKRGHEIDVLDTPNAYMNVVSHKPRVKYKGKEVPVYDAVIPRIGASTTFYGLAVLRQFEMMGVWPLNESVAIGRSRDKLRSMQLLSRKGIGLPITAFANSTADIDDMINMVGGAPVVIKLLEGTQGIGVILAETHMSAKSTIEAFRNVNVNILVQEYIRESEGADIRCFVIGDKVVAAMQRKGAAGEFRSNIHRGGSGEIIKITPEERSVAVRSAQIMGLNVCGVDLLRANHGPVIMEVNSSPGLEGVEKYTGIDVADKIIQFIEKKATPNKTKTRGKG